MNIDYKNSILMLHACVLYQRIQWVDDRNLNTLRISVKYIFSPSSVNTV